MKKWGVLLLAAMLLTALALGAGAEEFFAEESFGGEESFAGEGFFEEEFFAEEPSEDVTEEAPPEEAAEELEDRSVITIAPDLEAGEWEQDEEDYWKVAPVLQAEGKGKGQIVLTWVQDLHTEDDEGYSVPKTGFPSKDIKYYVYEVNPNGVMTQVGKPVVIAKKPLTVKAENEVGEYENFTGYGASVTLKNVAAGTHTYIVRAEKQTKASTKSKLYAEEYGEASNQVEALSWYDDPYTLKNLNVYPTEDSFELEFVADYFLVGEMEHWEPGETGIEVKAEYTLLHFDDETYKETKLKGTSIIYLTGDDIEVYEEDVESWMEYLGYKLNGKGFGNPVIFRTVLPEHEIVTKNGKYQSNDENNLITEAKFSVRYVPYKGAKTKAASSNKYKVSLIKYDDIWKDVWAYVEPGEHHTVSIDFITEEYATEYVLGGLKDNLSLIRNDTLKQTGSGKYKEWVYTGEPRFEGVNAEWVLYNNTTKQIIEDGVEIVGEGLTVNNLEAAGNKTTATITVQPKQNKASGKKFSQTVTFWDYWKKAPIFNGGGQSGDQEVWLRITAPREARHLSVTGFEKNITVDLEENESGELTLKTSDASVEGECEDFDDGIGIYLIGKVKKPGNVKFTVQPINGKEKGEKATETIQVIAAKDSGALDIGWDGTEIGWKHINPDVVRYVVTANTVETEQYGSKGYNIFVESAGDRMERRVEETDALNGMIWVDIGERFDNALIEGFDKDGGRIVTGYSLQHIY